MRECERPGVEPHAEVWPRLAFLGSMQVSLNEEDQETSQTTGDTAAASTAVGWPAFTRLLVILVKENCPADGLGRRAD